MREPQPFGLARRVHALRRGAPNVHLVEAGATAGARSQHARAVAVKGPAGIEWVRVAERNDVFVPEEVEVARQSRSISRRGM